MTLVYTIGVLAICAAAAAGHATPSPGPTSVTQAKRAALAAQATQAMEAKQAKPPPPATQCGAWEKGVSLTGHDFAHSKTGSAAACCVRSGVSRPLLFLFSRSSRGVKCSRSTSLSVLCTVLHI